MNPAFDTQHGTVRPALLLERMRWRYSCRNYDRNRSIEPALWSVLEETLRLTPSSYGLQPWKFFAITDPELRQQLYPLSHNQPPVLEASHLIVFTAIDRMLPEDITRWCRRRQQLRGDRMSQDDFEGMQKALTTELLFGSRKDSLFEWASEQAHIALGNFLLSCALLGIDASPMGGIKAREIDVFLGLKEKRLRTVVLCAAGYRAPSEPGTGGDKERFARTQIIETLPAREKTGTRCSSEPKPHPTILPS